MTPNPEVGASIATGDLVTNYHDAGEGQTVLLLHGSGPGVSAWANWRLTYRDLSDRYRLIAPDLAGFGFTQVPNGMRHDEESWVRQITDFLDVLEVPNAHVVGNSFGGAMALALAIRHPERVRRLVLMGSVGTRFDITEGLDAVWGYEPSAENMRRIMDYFTYDQSLIDDDLVQMRYRASAREGVQESYATMFPAPRQQWVDRLAQPEEALRALPHPTLIVHGRDDRVIPLSSSIALHHSISDSQLHIFGRCGHWTQIEHAHEFARLVDGFLAVDA